jgi:hypothetical protein
LKKSQPLLSKLQRNAKETLDKPKKVLESAVQLSFPQKQQKPKSKLASAA